jgi:predicted Zn-dependent protease
MIDVLSERFAPVAPAVSFWSLRYVDARDESLSVVRGVPHPPHVSRDCGVMITVIDQGGLGYAATSDVSDEGLRRAGERAHAWARATAARSVAPWRPPERVVTGEYETPVARPWDAIGLAEKLDWMRAHAARLHRGPDARRRIVDWAVGLWWTELHTGIACSHGTRIEQRFRFLVPTLRVSANRGSDTQTRTCGGHAVGRQAGLELLDTLDLSAVAERLPDEALELLDAPRCPTGTLDLVLAADQMILQLHESIGHPLELDRVLGDERNYAGTSFVRPEMFGSYRYGSELLNVTFDPGHPEELASYAFDDEGTPAERACLIREGVLLRGLGGQSSQLRSGLPGVASTRACSWNRPPIDRMANLNIEPGGATLRDLIAGVERGVYMETNCSWSIDDSRNKFQFSCERARVIEDGELRQVVKSPSYRGVSATFWRSLSGVGNAGTVQTLGSPSCGKGEPNQAIRVGHAAPPCRFRDVEVFGGA